MAAPPPLPTRASLRDLLADLLGRPVRVEVARDQELTPEQPAAAAAYRREDGSVGAVCIASRTAIVSTAAAIGMAPEARMAAQIESDGKLTGDVLDFFKEVVNVAAKLMNSPNTRRVILQELLPVPGPVPADMAAIILEPGHRVDYIIDVDGLTPGVFTLLSS